MSKKTLLRIIVCLTSMVIFSASLTFYTVVQSKKESKDSTESSQIQNSTAKEDINSEAENVDPAIILDNEYIKIVLKYSSESKSGITATMYVENKLNEDVEIIMDNYKFKNLSLSDTYKGTLLSKEKKLIDVSIKSEYFERVKDILDVSFDLHINRKDEKKLEYNLKF